jgi:hypothetical protein
MTNNPREQRIVCGNCGIVSNEVFATVELALQAIEVHENITGCGAVGPTENRGTLEEILDDAMILPAFWGQYVFGDLAVSEGSDILPPLITG